MTIYHIVLGLLRRPRILGYGPPYDHIVPEAPKYLYICEKIATKAILEYEPSTFSANGFGKIGSLYVLVLCNGGIYYWHNEAGACRRTDLLQGHAGFWVQLPSSALLWHRSHSRLLSFVRSMALLRDILLC